MNEQLAEKMAGLRAELTALRAAHEAAKPVAYMAKHTDGSVSFAATFAGIYRDTALAIEPLFAAPVAAAEWMPIESAPKDGRAILVNAGGFSYSVEWSEEVDWWCVDDNKLGPFRLRGCAPTHWMPLPPAPEMKP